MEVENVQIQGLSHGVGLKNDLRTTAIYIRHLLEIIL